MINWFKDIGEIDIFLVNLNMYKAYDSASQLISTLLY